jgi:glycosyltransferase involved in cell wall biosynthesis
MVTPINFHQTRREISFRYLYGKGVEIGAAYSPVEVSENVKVKYIDLKPSDEIKKFYPHLENRNFVEVDIIDNGEKLESLHDSSVDFVIANHMIEHCQDPISTLRNFLRVIKPDGILYMAVPDKRYTFDRNRPVTMLEHLIRDYTEGPMWSEMSHLEEWVRLAEQVPENQVSERIQELVKSGYNIHYHVWTQWEFQELLLHCKKHLRFPFDIECCQKNDLEFILIIRKTQEDASVLLPPLLPFSQLPNREDSQSGILLQNKVETRQRELETSRLRLQRNQHKLLTLAINSIKSFTNIYVLCPDTNNRHGGIKQLYRHVDVLRKHGFSAFLLHKQNGFKCDWFKTNAPVVYESEVNITKSDYLVVPEVYGSGIANLYPGVKKVIYNQNAYYSFWEYPIDKDEILTPYLHKDVVAALMISDDNKNYLNHVFPHLPIFRIRYGFDPKLFSYDKKNKNKKIAFMTAKKFEDIRQVINILRFRGVLKNYDLVPIENKTEDEVASILRESSIFLWFAYHEGWSLPPAEAMASGCVVIGYQTYVVNEQILPEFSYPITRGDTVNFAKTVEEVINTFTENPQILEEKIEKAVHFIKEGYSLEREEKEIIEAWQKILVDLPKQEAVLNA